MPLTIQEIVKDERFLGLSEPEQTKVLQRLDDKFTQLPPEEQTRTLRLLKQRSTAPSMTARPMTQPVGPRDHGTAPEPGTDLYHEIQTGEAIDPTPIQEKPEPGTDLYHQRQTGEEIDLTTVPDAQDTDASSDLRKGTAEVAGVGLEIAGGIAGAMSGAALGSRVGPVGAIVGGVAGAALGSAAGTLARQPIDVAGGLHPALSSTELLKAVATSAVTGAAFEGAGRSLIAAWNKAVYEPLGRYLTSGKLSKTVLTPEQEALTKQAEKMGVTLRPSEVTGSDRAGMVEQTVRRSIFGRNYFDALDVTNEASLRTHMDDLATRFIQPGTVSKLEAGSILQDTLAKKSTPLFRAAETQFYKRVKDLAGADGVRVDGQEVLPSIKTLMQTVDPAVQPASAALLRRMESLLTEEVVTQSAPKGSGIPTKTKVVPRQLEWMDAQDMRSMLLELGRSKELLKDREQGLANTAAEKLRGAMESTARASGSDVYRVWREAQAFSKRGHDILEDSTIKRIVTAYPEDAVGILFKKEAITENKRLVDALAYAGTADSSAALNAYRRAAIESVVTKASSDGFLTGHRLHNALYGQNGVGKELMQAVFDPGYLKELDATLAVAKRLNMSASAGAAGNPSQTGRSLVNWFEQSMLINIPADFAKHVMKGEFGPGLANAAANIQQSGVYILSMKETGKLLNSPEGLRVLRQGMQIGEKGEKAWRVAAQLLGHITKDSMAEITEAVDRVRESDDPKAGNLTTVKPMQEQR